MYHDNNKDFVRRCLELLNSEVPGSKYDVTKTICYSLGLLVFTKELIGKNEDAIPGNTVFNPIIEKASFLHERLTVNNVAHRLRNSISHGRFSAIDENGDGVITHLEFIDKVGGTGNIKFYIKLTINEFVTFIKEYAQYYLSVTTE